MFETPGRTGLAVAREAQGWTQRVLAERAGVSQSALSKAEQGVVPLPPAAAARVAMALDVPVDVLARPILLDAQATMYVHHRRRASTMAVRVTRRVEAVAQLTALAVNSLIDGVDLAPERSLSEELAEQDPVESAQRLRQLWGMPSGPIAHLLGVVESAGIIVVARDLFTASQDALSVRLTSPGLALTVITRGMPADRQRFTMAHELGHLVLHTAPREGQEQDANRFASEFLAPAAEIADDLRDLRTGDFDRLLKLKSVWGMSVAALIRRAFDVGEISDRQYREFQIRLGRMGWRQTEPQQPAREMPTTMARLIQLRETHGENLDALALRAGMTTQSFIDVFLPSRGAPKPTLSLRQETP